MEELSGLKQMGHSKLLGIHLNIRSIKTYWNLLIASMDGVLNWLDFTALAETGMQEDDKNNYNIEGFKMESVCRQGRRSGEA